MSFATQNAEAIVAAYGGVYPAHPDADLDHRRCLAMALCKVIDLVFKDLPEEFTESEWHMGYWSCHMAYRLQMIDLVDALMETGGFNET